MAGCSRPPARHAKVPKVAVDHLTRSNRRLPRRSTPGANSFAAQQNCSHPRRWDRGFESRLLHRRVECEPDFFRANAGLPEAIASATNYDRLIAVCYALGEYQSVTTANGSVYAGLGDTRNLVTEPVNRLDPISGQTHPQEDVFFQKVKAQ